MRWISKMKLLGKLVAFPLILVVIGSLFFYYRHVLSFIDNIEEIQSFGDYAWFIYIIAQTLQVLLFFIPGEVVQILGGSLFGIVRGSIYSIIGILIGSSLNYAIGRFFGDGFIETIFGKKKFSNFLVFMHTKKTLWGLLVLFGLPGIPKDVLCYFAGAGKVRFDLFLLISMLARIPGIVGSSVMGTSLVQKKWTIVLLLFLFAVIIAIVVFIFRKRIYATWEE